MPHSADSSISQDKRHDAGEEMDEDRDTIELLRWLAERSGGGGEHKSIVSGELEPHDVRELIGKRSDEHRSEETKLEWAADKHRQEYYLVPAIQMVERRVSASPRRTLSLMTSLQTDNRTGDPRNDRTPRTQCMD